MKKRILSVLICICLALTGAITAEAFIKEDAKAASEVRAVWLAYVDYYKVGLRDKSESKYRANLAAFLKKIKYHGCNTVYFHVRSFDDAVWKSDKFKASKSLMSRAGDYSTSRKAFDKLGYDPLKVFVEECRKQRVSVHAWMNPYRVSSKIYYDPAQTSTTERIKTAVREVLSYGVDGIHFDDYFYHGSKYKMVGYTNDTAYKISITSSKKKAYINKMVTAVYTTVKQTRPGALFGISPQGNLGNCRGAGADIDTWLSKTGYIDYIIPQIYWTDNWGSSGKTPLFTRTIKQWKDLRKNSVKMYIGLALYRSGATYSDDKGWSKRVTNIRTQIKLMRKYKMNGYSLYAASDFYRSGSKAKELYKVKGLVKPVYPKSIKLKSKSKTIKRGKKYKIGVIWNPSDTNPKSVTFKSSNKKVATVTSKGTVKGIKKGKATITVKTKNKGRTAKFKVKVK
ncbi:MAG: family 10 glycosylhydrolase [Eubacteriales bacterium]|nr:family 10 glycosylhydrolase [Eubacteriales bacterium]NLF47158.1 family 10 glycosylhydrolase [Clostridiales bacterium]